MRSISINKNELEILNMGSISSRKHEMAIWQFSTKGTETIESYFSCPIKGMVFSTKRT